MLVIICQCNFSMLSDLCCCGSSWTILDRFNATFASTFQPPQIWFELGKWQDVCFTTYTVYLTHHISHLQNSKLWLLSCDLSCRVNLTVSPMLDLQRLTALLKLCTIKGIDLSTITHSHVVPNLFDLLYSMEYKIRSFWIMLAAKQFFLLWLYEEKKILIFVPHKKEWFVMTWRCVTEQMKWVTILMSELISAIPIICRSGWTRTKTYLMQMLNCKIFLKQ